MLQGPPALADLLRWWWQRRKLRAVEGPLQGPLFEVLRPDVEFLRQNRSQPTLTWIGHVTFLLQLGGLNILTDPHLTARTSPVSFAGPKRLVPLPLAIEELPAIDVVLLSHSHYDHLDRGTVRRLARQAGGEPLFLVPLGLGRWFRRLGIERVIELDWWQSEQLEDLQFHFVPAQHWSKRTPWDTNRSLWGGWYLKAPGFSFHFAGDSGYSKDFVDIRDRLGAPDLAALPIGAYEPRWFMHPQHVDPDEAVRILQDLQAPYAVAMHWGTFCLTDEPMDEPPQRLARALQAHAIAPERFCVMKIGETRDLNPLRRQAPSQAEASQAGR